MKSNSGQSNQTRQGNAKRRELARLWLPYFSLSYERPPPPLLSTPTHLDRTSALRHLHIGIIVLDEAHQYVNTGSYHNNVTASALGNQTILTPSVHVLFAPCPTFWLWS
jgi:hypothetical protein